jgi:hypothetical protein
MCVLDGEIVQEIMYKLMAQVPPELVAETNTTRSTQSAGGLAAPRTSLGARVLWYPGVDHSESIWAWLEPLLMAGIASSRQKTGHGRPIESHGV